MEEPLKNPFLQTTWQSDEEGMYITCDGVTVCEIRGWGYLTSVLELSPERASQVQAEVQMVITDAVNTVINKMISKAEKKLKGD